MRPPHTDATRRAGTVFFGRHDGSGPPGAGDRIGLRGDVWRLDAGRGRTDGGQRFEQIATDRSTWNARCNGHLRRSTMEAASSTGMLGVASRKRPRLVVGVNTIFEQALEIDC